MPDQSRLTVDMIIRLDRVIVVAHRGNSRQAPENTLPAFRSAVDLGVDFVELDYLHSADGVPVAFHDEDLDRLTNARSVWGGEKIPLASKTLAELKMLDAGSWFGPAFAGTRIPTLSEAIDAILPRSLPLIERKAGDARTFVDLVERGHHLYRLAVMAFDWDYLAECRKLAPQLTLGALGEHDLTDRQLDEIVTLGAAFVGWNDKHLTKNMIDAIHARGLKAWVWTVDDPERARQLLDWGIDAITSNLPAMIKDVLAAHPRGRQGV